MMNYFADDTDLRELALWTLGSLSGANLNSLLLTYGSLIALFILFYLSADKLNILLLGEPEAKYMGIQVQKLKQHLILLTAFGVAVSVSVTGIIGFIGLIIPHLGRLLTGPNHRYLLPLSMLLGALILLLADILSRLLIPSGEVPVSIITALIGAPFFLWLLVQNRRGTQ